METSMLAFATDLRDEGMGTVLDNVQSRAGVDGLSMAVAYHDARDLFPHNPVRKVRYLEGGAVFFPPDIARYGGMRLQPRLSELARTGDPLGELCEAAGDRGIRVNAWAVFLHNDRLGFAHPECATQNAFGDRYLTDLCPSNPDVRVYARLPRTSPATASRPSSRSRSTSTASGTAITTNAISRISGLSASTCSGCASVTIASRLPAAKASTPGWFIGWYATNSGTALRTAGVVKTPKG